MMQQLACNLIVLDGEWYLNADKSKPNALCLDQFLKINAIAETGGQAKVMIQEGEVKLNGQVETRRRKKLSIGDVVEVDGRTWIVQEGVA